MFDAPLSDPTPPAGQVVSLTLNLYPRRTAWQGMAHMGTDHLHLRRLSGLQFYRLLGTGRGSDLTLGADLRRWARFAVWSSPEALKQFEDSAWRTRERARTVRSTTLVLRPERWHGQWGGVNPFEGPQAPSRAAGPGGPVAVLTRAAIRPGKLVPFWRAVPAAQRRLSSQAGLVFALGIGEVPLLYQATFSLWDSTEAMQAFAYGGQQHREVIARTRREGWYREELFARFTVLDVLGEGGLPGFLESHRESETGR
ncbi:hypothetical protein [Deinococcus hohokamensis]|uniref:Spheroidene monooxygenase n=1 Tax=Deinococcus hohokamensis TaxID=309883 RepID=A0ABV9IES0_9DEIO